MLNFDEVSIGNDDTTYMRRALDECLMALKEIHESDYRLDTDSNNRKVWSVFRWCQKKAKTTYEKHKHYLG